MVEAITEAGNHCPSNFQDDDHEQNVVDSLQHACGEKGFGRDQSHNGEHQCSKSNHEQKNGENDVEDILGHIENLRGNH